MARYVGEGDTLIVSQSHKLAFPALSLTSTPRPCLSPPHPGLVSHPHTQALSLTSTPRTCPSPPPTQALSLTPTPRSCPSPPHPGPVPHSHTQVLSHIPNPHTPSLVSCTSTPPSHLHSAALRTPFYLHSAIVSTDRRACSVVQQQRSHLVVTMGAGLMEGCPAGIVLHIRTHMLNLQKVLCHALHTGRELHNKGCELHKNEYELCNGCIMFSS